ncbi:hypothetical protein CKF54_02130 [Psittacicella hinzii]|uniref:Porin domain-containing protein n=1 Tax=Psittacicella hinzii TaxID=2028575 RepID=A0A3A1Y8Y0_9GAMM|nr:porin [Psittacicella hinzii]RIY33776.1 hypothetical protein CKF54_02130 [Psittacicella hinzii]
MKKTLLTLALASLVGSAFANTTVYQSDVARLYVDGYTRFVYAYEKNKDGLTSKTTNQYVKARYRLAFGGDFRVADSTAYGFRVRLQNNFLQDGTSKVYTYATDATAKSHLSEGTQYFAFDRAYVYLANDQFGRLQLGRQTTVVDGAADSDLEYLDFLTALRANTRTTGNQTVYYTSPVFNNFVFEYSYSQTKHNRKLYSSIADGNRVVQNAFAGTYAFSTGTAVKATAVFENLRNTEANVTKKKGFEVAVVQKLLNDDLTVAAAYDYVRTQNKDGVVSQVTNSTDKHHSVVVKASYRLNQYFQPYAGATYQKLDLESANAEHKVAGFYLGAQSDVYQLDTFKVRVFGETLFLRDRVKNESTDKKRTIKDTAFAAGVKVSF